YSNEVLTRSGAKYQLWAIPVSLRQRKSAARQEARATAARAAEREGRSDHAGRGGRGGLTARGLGGFGGLGGSSGPVSEGPVRSGGDRAMDDLRELWESREKAESAQGEVSVRWAWEILGPALAGAVVLGILLAVG
ncbi:PH domain-containing protein, partial [Streptomyces sp. NPDC002920]